MMSLFGKKKEPKQPSTADTLALLAENIALLEKKQEHLQAKVRGEIDLTVLVALFEEFFLFCFFLFFFFKKKKKTWQVVHEQGLARQNASRNKRLALAALKRKKLYENQCNKLQDTIVTLQQQEIALQNLATNVEILGTMNQVGEKCEEGRNVKLTHKFDRSKRR
jgi:hypothetical protein